MAGINTLPAGGEKEKMGEAEQAPRISPEKISPEKVLEVARTRAAAIENEAAQLVKSGKDRVAHVNDSVGLDGPAVDATRAELGVGAELTRVEQEADMLSREAQERILAAAEGSRVANPETKNFLGVRLKTTYSQEKLSALRDPVMVGKEKYGVGLVNTFQKDDMAVHEQELAQEQGMVALNEKIGARLVDPEALGADMMQQLEVGPDLVHVPEDAAGMIETVSAELDLFVEKKFITPEEAALIKNETARFGPLYQEAFPDAPAHNMFEILRDNARKIAYQTKMDKEVFSGSDHGTRHILEGNIKFADQMVESLQQQGIAVSPRDAVLIHQVIIDHDCGYDCGCAQARGGFEASKDHPIFSTKFIEANKDYYVDKFGEEGYTTIRNSVLYHSYPVAEYQGLPQGESGINVNLVRSITSTVDSLGVTAETKTPAFFRKPESIAVLLKIKLALEFSEAKDKRGEAVLPEDAMQKYKQELMAVADAEENPRRKEGFKRSIGDFFNEFTAQTTLGHYTGVVERVGVTNQNGKIVPKIDMRMSRIHALLGDMFGGKLETQAFTKAMKDFGVKKKDMQQFGRTLELARRSGAKPEAPLMFQSDRAVFEVAPQLAEDAEDSFADVREVVALAYGVSIRAEINGLLAEFESNPVDARKKIPEIQAKFEATITQKTTMEELTHIQELTEALLDEGGIPIQDEEGNSLTKAAHAARQLRRFKTKKEKEFLGET